MENGGKSEGIIVILHPSAGDSEEVEGFEEGLEDFDMSEEMVYRSGQVNGISRDYIDGTDIRVFIWP